MANNVHDPDLEKQIADAFSKRVSVEFDKTLFGDIWKPESYEREKIMKQNALDWQKQLLNDWEKVRKNTDPIERLRRETNAELNDIKRAIRKMGILLDSDKPTEEQLEKHKTLKDAYLKYKMVEALVLGGEKNV